VDSEAAVDAEAREKQAQSIASWARPRAAFSAKLRRAKEKLNTIERNLASAAKTEMVWREKFMKLLDREDTDGTGQYAKQIMRAEIEELEKKKDEEDEIARELKLEEEYRQRHPRSSGMNSIFVESVGVVLSETGFTRKKKQSHAHNGICRIRSP
jgi:hypothetical protein